MCGAHTGPDRGPGLGRTEDGTPEGRGRLLPRGTADRKPGNGGLQRGRRAGSRRGCLAPHPGAARGCTAGRCPRLGAPTPHPCTPPSSAPARIAAPAPAGARTDGDPAAAEPTRREPDGTSRGHQGDRRAAGRAAGWRWTRARGRTEVLLRSPDGTKEPRKTGRAENSPGRNTCGGGKRTARRD